MHHSHDAAPAAPQTPTEFFDLPDDLPEPERAEWLRLRAELFGPVRLLH